VGTPQPGIFAVGTRAHHHLEFDLDPGATRDDAIAAVARVREAATTVAGVNLVVGVRDATPFEPIAGVDGFAYPAAQHDLWLWLHSASPDGVFTVARLAARELRGIATVAAEQPTFAFGASQDLSGFEDGTENPPIDEAVALLADGAVALVQRWVHDLDAFGALDLSDREAVFGRTLIGSEELDPLPHNSHVGRVVIEDDAGEELEVFRRSTAFGGVLEHGLLFVAFSPERARLQRMLDRMAGLEDGVRDRLTYFSTPTASAWYVIPSLEELHPA
jgi:putative iron-dependent peroxidase